LVVTSDQPVRWVVLKFGGTSVASAANWAIIRDLVRERLAEGYRPLVVHSAIGGISSQLELLLQQATEGAHEPLLEEIRNRHLALAAELGLDGEALLGELLDELGQLTIGIRLVREASSRVHAKVMALGEFMATTLGAEYLQSQGIATHWHDVRESLCSLDIAGASERASFLSAICAHDADPHLQAELGAIDGVVLTQGFVASNSRGETVLLGRGGSDTSGAYFAARLAAERLEIWTDVPGMFSADPRAVPGARLLRVLRYEEAQEIASTGGSVIHPRAISPVRRASIPLWIRSTARPEATGTVISHDGGDDAPRVKAISRRGGITLVSMETLGMWQEVGFLSEAFSCFSDLGLSIDLVSTSESNVTVTLDPGANSMDEAMMERLRLNLERLCRVRILPDVAVVSLVGQKIRAMLHEIGPALEVFQEHRIHLLSQAASDLNLSFVVDAEQAPRLVQNLHATLVQPPKSDAVFGETWEELQSEQLEPMVPPTPWWIEKRDQLIDIARARTSAYVYDRASIEAAVARLRSLTAVDQLFYAIKANSHPEVLRVVHAGGMNFEVVSPGEIELLLELFPDIDRQRILFTPNFAARSEYEFGLEQGVWVTLDNLHPLREWGDSFAGQQVFLRLDPGQGRGHHEHVKTAGVHSKFGIPLFELDEAAQLVAACGAEVVGLHAHTGSGILQADNWEDVAASLIAVCDHFPGVRILDLGGGLGIPENPGQKALDMPALDASLAAVRERLEGFELWLEPGRYVIAEAGVLVSTVTQTKGKGDVQYVGISTGMNSLIRPALYGAYHEITNISRVGEAATEIVNVVGPICETGDRLGSDRLLPPTREGDVLAIANAGAYGYVMSSRYNLREPAEEVVI
jgi:diaminopimelate decarboxylase/aspartate kinase